MSARYTQTKSEAQKHTEILKQMLKQPENKLCADCKRNVKSVDLDTWSPEQIENIQRWGNRRANAYWEAHLKAGHAPPEHKMDSFIRSKYESRRWAMEGPLPANPEDLDGPGDVPNPTSTSTAPPPVPASRPAPPTATRPAPRNGGGAIDLLAGPPSSSSSTIPAPRASISGPTLTTPSAPVAAPAAAPPAGNGLFDLDFSATAPAAAPKRDAKADILSLFASAPRNNPPPQPTQYQHQSSSSISSSGAGLAADLGGLNLDATSGASGNAAWGSMQLNPQQSTAGQFQSGAFGAEFGSSRPQANPSSFGGSSAPVWGAPQGAGSDLFGNLTGNNQASSQAGKKDVFSDIWN